MWLTYRFTIVKHRGLKAWAPIDILTWLEPCECAYSRTNWRSNIQNGWIQSSLWKPCYNIHCWLVALRNCWHELVFIFILHSAHLLFVFVNLCNPVLFSISCCSVCQPCSAIVMVSSFPCWDWIAHDDCSAFVARAWHLRVLKPVRHKDTTILVQGYRLERWCITFMKLCVPAICDIHNGGVLRNDVAGMVKCNWFWKLSIWLNQQQLGHHTYLSPSLWKGEPRLVRNKVCGSCQPMYFKTDLLTNCIARIHVAWL